MDLNLWAIREYDIKRVCELELNVIYVIDSYQKKTGCYGDYYYCKIYRKDTEEKINLRSSYYLKKEIEIYESKNLTKKFSFKVTKIRQNDYGMWVASVRPVY